MFFLPNLSISVVAIRCAPPQSASILPSMAPKPMISARLPSVPPTPALMELITLTSGIPCIRPTASATRTRAINPFILKRIIKSSNNTTPIATMTNGMIDLAFELLWVTSLFQRQIPVVPTGNRVLTALILMPAKTLSLVGCYKGVECPWE